MAWHRQSFVGLSVLLVALPVPSRLRAQELSEHYTVTQWIDSVEISLTGARPNARGRTIWGDVVPWNRSWVAGARSPTILTVGREFRINETTIPAGSYSLWIVPRPDDDWSLIIDPRTKVGHGLDPDSTDSQYHAHLKVIPVDHVETLSWTVPSVTGFRATVRMAWGNRAAEFKLAVKPSVSVVVPDDAAAAVVGDYVLAPAEYDRPGEPRDTLLSIRRTPDGRVTWLTSGTPDWSAEMGVELVLLPAGPDLFTWGMFRDGELVQRERNTIWEFVRENGKVTAFEARFFPSDRLWMSGTRRK